MPTTIACGVGFREAYSPEATTLVGVHPRLRMEERHGFVSTLVANTSFAVFLGNNPATTPLTT